MTRRRSPGARSGRPAAALDWGRFKRHFWGVLVRHRHFLSGVFLAAVRLRTGSLWTGIVLHGLWDAGTFLVAAGATSVAATSAASTALGDYGSIVMSLPLFLLGLYFLRHAGRDYGKAYT
jgi:hypothetical protein